MPRYVDIPVVMTRRKRVDGIRCNEVSMVKRLL